MACRKNRKVRKGGGKKGYYTFICKKCRRRVTLKAKSMFSAIRRHYWSKHRHSMLKGVQKRKR